MKKRSLVYILPLYDRNTDTHFRHLYDMIEELAKDLRIFVIVERGEAAGIAGIAGSVKLPANRCLRFLACFYRLLRLRTKGYRLCYSHYSYIGVLAGKLAGYKVFYWNCGQTWMFPDFNNNIILKFIFRSTDRIVTGTNFIAKGFADHYGLPLEKIAVIPNWIKVKDWEHVPPEKTGQLKRDQCIKPGDKIILFAHRLARRKGSHFLPAIWQAFADEKNLHFIIAGGGPDKDMLADSARQAGNKERIHLLGAVPNRDLAGYMHIADVFLMPSREEGFPRVAIEAMACGLPLVGFNTGGLEEILPADNLELLAEPDNIDELILKLRAVLSPDHRPRQTEAKQKAASYDLSEAAKKFNLLFEK